MWLRFVDGYIVLRDGLLAMADACCCAVSFCGETAICCGPDEFDSPWGKRLTCRQGYTRQQCDDIGGRWWGTTYCGPCIASSDDGPFGCDSLGPLPRNPLP